MEKLMNRDVSTVSLNDFNAWLKDIAHQFRVEVDPAKRRYTLSPETRFKHLKQLHEYSKSYMAIDQWHELEERIQLFEDCFLVKKLHLVGQ